MSMMHVGCSARVPGIEVLVCEPAIIIAQLMIMLAMLIHTSRLAAQLGAGEWRHAFVQGCARALSEQQPMSTAALAIANSDGDGVA